jgi:DNA-directed RNA polymerase specialized sigma subunit
LPSKVEVEAQLKERITDEIWEMAVNRFNGISVSVSCDHSGAFDDDSVSFDHILGDKSEEANGELEQNVFSTSILAIAKDVLSDNEYKVLTRYYLQDENYVEIHHHLDRPYSSKSISMIKTRAIAKVQARIEEMGGLATIRPL